MNKLWLKSLWSIRYNKTFVMPRTEPRLKAQVSVFEPEIKTLIAFLFTRFVI